uniref:Uncharacterized protein n=1 Tax=Arundo donax TaxID=35708 RepID=A0A0A9GS51_ARUDO
MCNQSNSNRKILTHDCSREMVMPV